jgi:hypothetical protein
MKNKKFKKLSRKINKEIRHLNRNIYDDELWKGRFYVTELRKTLGEWEDKSGIYGYWCLRFIDKETNKHLDKLLSDYDILNWRLWYEMNKFIVEYIDAWNVEPRLTRDTTKDYRKVH